MAAAAPPPDHHLGAGAAAAAPPDHHLGAGAAAAAPPDHHLCAGAAAAAAAAADAPQQPLNLLTLRFSSAALERAYYAYNSSNCVLIDTWGCVAGVLQLAAGVLYILIKAMPVPLQGVILMAGSGLLQAVHALLLSSSHYSQHRTAAVCLVLLGVRLLTAATIAYTPGDYSAATRILYKTGLIPLCWYGISLPLPFRYQVPVQLAAVLLYQAKLAIPACHVLSLEPRLLGLLGGVWHSMIAGLSLTLQSQGIALSQQHLPAAAAEAAADNPLLLCWSTVSFLLLLTGLVLPAPIWYCLELRSRARFYKQAMMQQQQREQQALASGSSISAAAAGSSGEQQHQQNHQQQQLLRRKASSSTRELAVAADGSFRSTQGQKLEGEEGVGGGSSSPAVPSSAPGLSVVSGDVFDVPVASLLFAMAAVCACSSLVIIAYGPAVLQLQLQLLSFP